MAQGSAVRVDDIAVRSPDGRPTRLRAASMAATRATMSCAPAVTSGESVPVTCRSVRVATDGFVGDSGTCADDEHPASSTPSTIAMTVGWEPRNVEMGMSK